jgi:ADP-ribose pyrophosphatase YjhB (NUDIX family)
MAEPERVIRQVGAIAFKPGATPMVLLVRAKNNPSQWIFPKGHIEGRETEEDASARELLEEAGINGKPVRRAGEREFQRADKKYTVVYFLCTYISTENGGEPGRTPRWCSIEEALSLLTFSDTRELLESAVPFFNEH